MRTSPPEDEAGMVLVNVLLLVGLAAAVLAIMLSGDDAALQRATRFAQAAQADAIARAGELSAVAALRRDMAAAPESDDATEPWAKIGERGAPIQGGRFALAIADATGTLDLNPLARADPVTRARLAALAAALELPPDAADRIAASLAATGPIADLAELGRGAIDSATLARLAPFCTALPAPQPINLNAAPEPLLAALLGDPVAARALADQRARTGRLTLQDLIAAHVRIPVGTGFTSALFWVRAQVAIGTTSQQRTSLLERRSAADRSPMVVAIARWRGMPPLQAPPLADRP